MSIFALYLAALVELAAFNPSTLTPSHSQPGPWLLHRSTLASDQKCSTDFYSKWTTRVYSWDEVEDLDFCAYNMVIDKQFPRPRVIYTVTVRR